MSYCKIYFPTQPFSARWHTSVNLSQKDSQIHGSFCTVSPRWRSMAPWTKGTPSMTSAKYISQSLFSSNSNPGYSGFALWRDRALGSPEIAIAHLSQGLRSSYHGERASFKFPSFQYAWQSRCTVNIEVWGALGVALPPLAPWQAQRTCNSPIKYLIAWLLSASNGRQSHLDTMHTLKHSPAFLSGLLNGYSRKRECLRVNNAHHRLKTKTLHPLNLFFAHSTWRNLKFLLFPLHGRKAKLAHHI